MLTAYKITDIGYGDSFAEVRNEWIGRIIISDDAEKWDDGQEDSENYSGHFWVPELGDKRVCFYSVTLEVMGSTEGELK